MQDAGNTVEAERSFSSIEEIGHEPDLTIRRSQQRPRMPGDGDNGPARIGRWQLAHGLPGTSTPAQLQLAQLITKPG